MLKLGPIKKKLSAKLSSTFKIPIVKISFINLVSINLLTILKLSSVVIKYYKIELITVTVSDIPETGQEPSVSLQKVGAPATSLNWATLGKVTSVKNMGNCGCCWSFSIAGLYESFLLVQGADSFDLSE